MIGITPVQVSCMQYIIISKNLAHCNHHTEQSTDNSVNDMI
jgi:hypothetical protein